MKKDPKIFLAHILENIALAEANVTNLDFASFLKNRALMDAVIREIEVIGEAVKNLPDDFKQRYPEIPWQDIADMRNKIVHEYFDIDWDIVWKTVQEGLPKLKSQIEPLL